MTTKEELEEEFEQYMMTLPKNPSDLLNFFWTKIEEIRKEDKERLVEKIEKIEEYIAVKDSSCHRYAIPKSKKEEWNEWCNIPEDDEIGWEEPEYAIRIDGGDVPSFKESILSIIKQNE